MPDDTLTSETSRVLSVRLPNDLAADIERRAHQVERSPGWWIRNALQVQREGMEARERQYPDPLPERTDGAVAHSYTATFAFRMPNFQFPEDTDLSIEINEGRIGTERRIENALNECADVLRRWGCTEKIVIHSIHDIGGSQLPSRITHFPEGTTEID